MYFVKCGSQASSPVVGAQLVGVQISGAPGSNPICCIVISLVTLGVVNFTMAVSRVRYSWQSAEFDTRDGDSRVKYP